MAPSCAANTGSTTGHKHFRLPAPWLAPDRRSWVVLARHQGSVTTPIKADPLAPCRYRGTLSQRATSPPLRGDLPLPLSGVSPHIFAVKTFLMLTPERAVLAGAGFLNFDSSAVMRSKTLAWRS